MRALLFAPFMTSEAIYVFFLFFKKKKKKCLARTSLWVLYNIFN